MDWIRKARGIAGVSLTWGALWGIIGAMIGFVIGLVDPSAWIWANPILDWGVGMGLYGLVSGAGFAKVFAFLEHRRAVEDLSPARAALWGVIGSAAVPLIFGALGAFPAGTTVVDILGAIGVTSFLGGTFASGSVAVARHAALEEAHRFPELEG